MFSANRQDLLISMRALVTAKEIYKLLPGATVDLGVASKLLAKMPWVRHIVTQSSDRTFELLPLDRSIAFSCIASLESGSFGIEPSSLEGVMAIAVEGSIYIAAPLLCDPTERPNSYEIRRVRGSIGKHGMALLIPPQNTRVRDDLDGKNWNLVNHNHFDGKSENSFSSTTMHLWFTDYILPLSVGNHGSRSFEVYFLESVVSVHDKGKWVADLNVLEQLEGRESHLQKWNFPRSCSKELHKYTGDVPLDSHMLTTIDDWNELLDGPDFVGIVRAHGNWLARLATACLSSQLKHHTFVLPSKLCWSCVVTAWINSCQTLERDTSEFKRMNAKELLGLMEGLILIC